MVDQFIRSKVLRTADVEWQRLKALQHEGFKAFSQEEKDKLRESILDNSFIQPFYVWETVEKHRTYYCLDGFHRILLLKELKAEGIAIPDNLPATFIDCADKQEAAKLVLLYSSQYAHITRAGYDHFIEANKLDAESMAGMLSIPGISDQMPVEEMPYPDELTADPKDKPAVMRITFPTVDELESAQPIIENILKERCPGYLISVSAGEI